jgi:hypothetical protein
LWTSFQKENSRVLPTDLKVINLILEQPIPVSDAETFDKGKLWQCQEKKKARTKEVRMKVSSGNLTFCFGVFWNSKFFFFSQ